MKELVILGTEVREENEMGFFKVVKFEFNGHEGVFTTTNICGMEINDVSFNLGFASWDRSGNISKNTFTNDDNDIFQYDEFLNAFNEKLGIEIPLV